MENYLDPVDGAPRDVVVGQIADQQLRVEAIQVGPLAGHEAVGQADTMAASKQFLDDVRADKTGAAGHEKRSHQLTNATRSLVIWCSRVEECCSRPVSRILFPLARKTTIHLAPALLAGSSNLPGSLRRAA